MEIADLIALAQRHSALFSKKNSGLPGCFIFKRDAPTDFEAIIYDPVICLILQGGKTLNAGSTTVTMAAGDALLVSHDMPVSSRITKASRENPYLALILSLDISLLRSLYEHIGVHDTRPTAPALSPFRANRDLVGAMSRYLALADDPLAADVLGPSVLREIHFRLLISPAGGMLRNLLSVSSHASRIAKAIRAIRQDFRAPLVISDLASLAGMSTSSFHEHFKTVTGTSPLQYQKDLRMIEARRLLAEGRVSVSAAGFEVGYESATQFSREFSRKFGTPPSRIAEIA